MAISRIGSNAKCYSVIQVPNGTNPTAQSPNETLTLVSVDGSIIITGDLATDTINLEVNSMAVFPSTPTIYNVSAPLANTEYSQALNANTKKFTIRCRDIATMRLAYVSGDTATNYITIPHGCTFSDESIDFTGTLYFRTTKAAQVIEILEWA